MWLNRSEVVVSVAWKTIWQGWWKSRTAIHSEVGLISAQNLFCKWPNRTSAENLEVLLWTIYTEKYDFMLGVFLGRRGPRATLLSVVRRPACPR